jgi:flavin reductase (DIM6/NTAB) family NADH-FMN oxidoreductase RutF/predicted transcriptional regulator
MTAGSLDIQALRLAALIYSNLAAVRAVVRSKINEGLRGFGLSLSSTEYSVLRVLAPEIGGASVGQLAEFFVIPRTSIRRVLNKLERQGMVASFQPPEDRRERRWAATGEGSAAIADVPGLPLSGDDNLVLANQLGVLLHALRSSGPVAAWAPAVVGSFEAAKDGGDPSAPFNLWLAISRAYHLIRNEQTRFLLGATDNALDTASYMALYRSQEVSPTLGETAAFLQVNQNAALRIIDRLEANGMVRRERRPIDRRHIVILPTEKGTELLAAVPPLDPSGTYINIVRSLPQGGSQLADALDRLVYGFFNKPAFTLSALDAVLSRLHQRAQERAEPKVERDVFRRAMSEFMTGVAVVTVGQAGDRRGITVNSLTSVSLEPPTLLICLDQRSPTLERLLRTRAFAANILSVDQLPLAQRFGRRETKDNPHSLDDQMSVDLDGVPVLVGALAAIVSDIVDTYEAGTHTIVLASVRRIVIGDPFASRGALGYWRSRYIAVPVESLADHVGNFCQSTHSSTTSPLQERRTSGV